MKRWIKYLLVVMMVLGTLLASTTPISAKEVFNISHYDIQIKVNSDGVFEITETLEVRFDEERHGIYLNIPTRYKMNWDNGNLKNYYFPVTDIKVLSSHEYEVERFSDFTRVILGSADRYSNTVETYKVSYKVHSRDLDLEGIQMFFYNIISGGWDCDVEYVTFNIELPKTVDFDDLYFDSPMGTTQVSREALSFNAIGNTISGSYNGTLAPREALTIKLYLPNDYFIFPTATANSLLVTIIGAIFTILGYFVFLKYGKDEQLIPVIEFDAPEGMNSAEVGYVIDGTCDTNDVVSLILFWAKEGQLRIDDDGDTLTLTKLAELPATSKEFEHTMFSELFDNRDVVTTEELKEKFYTSISKAQGSIYRQFKKGNPVYTSEGIQIFLSFFAGLPAALLNAVAIYHINLDKFEAIVAGGIALLFAFSATLFLIQVSNNWYTLKHRTVTIITAAIFAALVIIATFVTTQLLGDVSFVFFAVTIICTIICMFVVAQMRRRTRYGSEIIGRVVGLREFIITAEKERLEMLVRDNPTIFYDILPFAYALSLTDIWSEHFKDLEIPECEWYSDGAMVTGFAIGDRMSQSMSTLSSSMVSSPVSEGGGSSSGGGDFSGGGFGGSSGGSW